MEDQNNLQLNEQAIDALRESAKWSTFLAIMGFVGIGFMVLAGILMSTFMSQMPGTSEYADSIGSVGVLKTYMSLFYIVIAVVYFFPVYYLYKYAVDMKNALINRNSDMVSNALVYLKSHHKFLGIMTIVVISLYLLTIIGTVVFVASSMSKGM